MKYQALSESKLVFTTTVEIPNENVLKLYKEGFVPVISYGITTEKRHTHFMTFNPTTETSSSATRIEVSPTSVSTSAYSSTGRFYVSKVTIDDEEYTGISNAKFYFTTGNRTIYLRGKLNGLMYKANTKTVQYFTLNINQTNTYSGSSTAGSLWTYLVLIAKEASDLILSMWFEPIE